MFSLKSHGHTLTLYLMILSILFSSANARAEADGKLSSGETLYVAVYSNVYAGPKAVPHELATMLSIHNIDPKNTITISRVDYYDSNGKFIESYIKKPIKLKPLAHTFFYLKEYDIRGGPGANFIVKWSAQKKVNQPIVEALMLETRSGVSFSSKGQIITEHAE
ncbi:MAG: DUF3124 domain-containing protein [Nitrospirota bacterium]